MKIEALVKSLDWHQLIEYAGGRLGECSVTGTEVHGNAKGESEK